MKRRYFETFDAFRFFSFLLVFLHHIPTEDSVLSYFSHSGGIGVSFFFVLSGFLITYILLYEHQKHGKINLKNFFIRRVLRIWPLFYAMIAFAFITPYIIDFLGLSYSNEGYEPNWLMSILFLENYQMMWTKDFPNVSPLRVMWSLCIEEHFYIIWGLAFYFLRNSKIQRWIMLCFLISIITKIVYHSLHIETLDVFSHLDYFAFGAIVAYLLVFQENFIQKLERMHPCVKYAVLAFSFIFVLGLPHVDFAFQYIIQHLLLGLSFAGMIIFTLPTTNRLYISRKNIFSLLGKYTYGLYLIHPIVVNLFLKFRNDVPLLSNNYGFFLISLLTTILCALISYQVFEKQFLKLKKYFYH